MLTIKVPSVVQIGLHRYTIQLCKWGLKDEGYYSKVNHRRQVIEIDLARPPSQRFYALLHEVGHIIDNVYLDGGLTESQVNGIAEGYAQFLGSFDIELDWSGIPVVE